MNLYTLTIDPDQDDDDYDVPPADDRDEGARRSA